MVMSDTADVVGAALKALAAREALYRHYNDYYEGRHKLGFASEKFRNAFASVFKAFADNLCPAVVDAVAERLQLIGFGTEDDSGAGASEPASAAWDIWRANRMDRRSGECHREALVSGDAYLIVWPDAEGQPVLYPNPAANCTVEYDAETPGLILWAAKAWRLTDTGQLRLNLYWPDRIEKYVTRTKADTLPDSGRAFEPFQTPGEAWPLANPWALVPVFHFANNARTGQLGRSELGDVIPLQDALNKSVADMLVAMEYVSLPQRWATGLEVDIDPVTGKAQVPFTPGVERIWAAGDPDVKFGQFDPANLTQFGGVQDSFRSEIARVSGTPLHYLMLQTGEFPSGEAMKTAEARFLAKVQARQLAWGNVWEDALGLALRMAGRASGGTEQTQLSALWKDPTPHSEKEMAEVAVLKSQLGVSESVILSELGYSPEQIEQMQEETKAKKADMADQMLREFEQQQDDGTDGETQPGGPGSNDNRNGRR